MPPASKAIFPNRPVAGLLMRAQSALGMTHAQFGEALGASQRTAARWAAGQSTVDADQLRTLARLVHPRHPALAGEIAAAASETLESLGLVAATPPKIAVDVAIDAVLLAAAAAMNAPPAPVRAGLLAALRRARELRIDAASLEAALAVKPSSS
jgi:hypothetical protein